MGNRYVKIKVINDADEKAIAMITLFNRTYTNQKDQHLYLLRIIKKHNKHFPKLQKIINFIILL